MIVLDTNVVIAVLNGFPSSVLQRFEEATRDSLLLAIPTVVLFELLFGAVKSRHPSENVARISDFMAGTVSVVPFDAEDAYAAGEVRAILERSGTPIGPYDTLIAGQARRRDALLVTANTREFSRVPGLRIEDWTTTET